MGVKYLLDTHSLVWAFLDSFSLSKKSKKIIEDSKNEVYISPVSSWEISIKYHLGKLNEDENLFKKYKKYVIDSNFMEITINSNHSLKAGSLPKIHKDPFDRMLIAQAQIENMTIITADSSIKKYDVKTLW